VRPKTKACRSPICPIQEGLGGGGGGLISSSHVPPPPYHL
jgi:hypothetical protein